MSEVAGLAVGIACGLRAGLTLGRSSSSAPGIGDSVWYPTRSAASANVAARNAAFNVADVPDTGWSSAFTEATKPVTTLSATVSDSTAYATQCAINGTHVTVSASTSIAAYTACAGSNIRVTFGSACTVGVHFVGPGGSNADGIWFEGATTGTRTAFNTDALLGNLLTQFGGGAINVGFTNIDFNSDPIDGGNLAIATDRWVFEGCRFNAYGPNSANHLADCVNTAYYNCNFFTDSGTTQGRWNIRQSGNGARGTVVLDCALSTNGSPYACIRTSGIGWWINGCYIDGGCEMTLEAGHEISYAHFTDNVVYRTTSFAGNGTLDNVTISRNTFHSSAGAQSDAAILTAIQTASVADSNMTISGNTFAATNHTLLANGTWPDPPGDPR